MKFFKKKSKDSSSSDPSAATEGGPAETGESEAAESPESAAALVQDDTQLTEDDIQLPGSMGKKKKGRCGEFLLSSVTRFTSLIVCV